jgi:hypothetical protein
MEPKLITGIRRIPGDFEARIALLTGLGNGKSPRHRQQSISKLAVDGSGTLNRAVLPESVPPAGVRWLRVLIRLIVHAGLNSNCSF